MSETSGYAARDIRFRERCSRVSRAREDTGCEFRTESIVRIELTFRILQPISTEEQPR